MTDTYQEQHSRPNTNYTLVIVFGRLQIVHQDLGGVQVPESLHVVLPHGHVVQDGHALLQEALHSLLQSPRRQATRSKSERAHGIFFTFF